MSSPNTRNDLSDLLRECVSSFPLYEPSQHFHAHESKTGQIDAEYSMFGFSPRERKGGCTLHVVVMGDIGYVNNIRIPKIIQLKGFGKALMACAEDFLKKAGCAKSILSPSGDTRDVFYGKLGYVPLNDLEMHKIL